MYFQMNLLPQEPLYIIHKLSLALQASVKAYIFRFSEENVNDDFLFLPQ